MTDMILHHFNYSHFNEKARWALAYKNVPHRRVGQVPGRHAKPLRRLSGQTMTPVLQIGDEVIAGSGQIIARLESLYPEPALYPSDPAELEQALAWQQRLDTDLGPDTRSIVWGVLIEVPRYTARVFGRELNPLLQFGYSFMLKAGRDLIIKVNKVSPDDIARARSNVALMLDEIATAVEATGYLVGEQFSVADLTAACLISPVLHLQHTDMRRPEPWPPALLQLIEEYATHPAIIWAERMFTQHRPDVVTAAPSLA